MMLLQSGPAGAMRMGDVAAGIKTVKKLKVERVQYDVYRRPDSYNLRPVGSSAAARCGMAEPSGKAAPMGHKSCYKDSWTDSFLLGLCVRRLSQITGISTSVKGYDGFVEVTRQVMQTHSPLLQRASSMRVLHSAIPPWLLKIVRRFLPNTQKTAETFAAATLYAEWLVGPCEVKEVEVNGVTQKSGVLIKKMQVPREQQLRGVVRQYVQDSHPRLLHKFAGRAGHHDSQL